MFSLIKWYGDVVTDDGACAIIYAARLRWGLARLNYAATLLQPVGGPTREAATIVGVRAPRFDGDGLAWSNTGLDATGVWRRDAAPIESRLARFPGGDVTWTCHMPRAHAAIRFGKTRFEGLGYIEELRLTIAPWKMGIRTLRWGRHLSGVHALVWIDWVGTTDAHWVWLDGTEQPAATICDSGVRGLEGGVELRWQRGRALRDRPLADTLRGPLPALARRLGGYLPRFREHKRVAPSEIVFAQGSADVDRGWTVHEEVTW